MADIARRPRWPRVDRRDQRSRVHGRAQAAAGGRAFSDLPLRRLARAGGSGAIERKACRLPLGQARYAAAVRHIPDPRRVVRDGNVITGGGVTAGIDFALVVAAELSGEAFAQLNIEYASAPPFDSGRPETATPEALAMSRARYAKLLPGRLECVRAAAARSSVA